MENFQNDIRKAIEVLNAGGVILYPTDTVWGLGCDATNKEAVQKIYKIKQREESKSLILLMEEFELVSKFVANFDEKSVKRIINNSEKPTTVIYQGAKNLASNVIADNGSVAIRITNEIFSNQLCKSFGKPIVSTSANISGEPTAQNFSEISELLINSVDYVVAYKQADTANPEPSRILLINEKKEIQVLRD